MSEYPNEDDLNAIRTWDIITIGGLRSLLDFLSSQWMYGDSGYFELKGKNVLKLRLSTAGWSGNEDRINALSDNIFWMMFWEKSLRGGHHYFKINLKTFFPNVPLTGGTQKGLDLEGKKNCKLLKTKRKVKTNGELLTPPASRQFYTSR